jgi:hypothetical protein
MYSQFYGKNHFFLDNMYKSSEAFPPNMDVCQWQCTKCLHFRHRPEDDCLYCKEADYQAELKKLLIPLPPNPIAVPKGKPYIPPSKREHPVIVCVQEAPEKKAWKWGLWDHKEKPWVNKYAKAVQRQTPKAPPPPKILPAKEPVVRSTKMEIVQFPKAPSGSINWADTASHEWFKNRFEVSVESVVESSVQDAFNHLVNPDCV